MSLKNENSSSEKQIKGLITTISHFKKVIRKMEIISQAAQTVITKNDAVIHALALENNKKLKQYEKNKHKFTTEEKLEKITDILFTNFDMVNKSMESKSKITESFYNFLNKTKNINFASLKSIEYLLNKESEQK